MRVTAKVVAAQIAKELGTSTEDILSTSRGSPHSAFSRWASMCAWRLLNASPKGRLPTYTAVGRAFSRDRTSVRHALEMFDEDPLLNTYREACETVVSRLRR